MDSEQPLAGHWDCEPGASDILSRLGVGAQQFSLPCPCSALPPAQLHPFAQQGKGLRAPNGLEPVLLGQRSPHPSVRTPVEGTHPVGGDARPFTTWNRLFSSRSSQDRSQNFSDTAPQKVAKVRSLRA